MTEILIFSLLTAFLLRLALEILNYRSSLKVPDPLVAHVYQEGERSRSIRYVAAKNQISLLSKAINFLVMAIALSFGWFAHLDKEISARITSATFITMIFFAIIGLAYFIIRLPFIIWTRFVIEARFGFNKTTGKTFVTDLIKGGILIAILGGPLLAAVHWLYGRFESQFWLYGFFVFAGFSTFMFMFGTKLVLPLFNKLTPLEDNELKIAVSDYCHSQGYSLKNLYTMDGSRRSTKANAFFSGIGRSKTIVLFDTLIQKLDKDEIVAVLAHEIGHYKLRHTLSMFLVSNIQTLVTFGILGWTLGFVELSKALGASEFKFHLSVLAFFILLIPISIALDVVSYAVSRRNELAADTFASKTFKKSPLASALVKTATDHLTNPSPHPIYVIFNNTHPPLVQRLRNLEGDRG